MELIHLLDSVPVAAWEAHCECRQGSALSGDSTWTRPSVRVDTPAVLPAGGQPVDSARGQLPRDTVGVRDLAPHRTFQGGGQATAQQKTKKGPNEDHSHFAVRSTNKYVNIDMRA